MTAAKTPASVSLDLDDLWTYLRTRGDPSWEHRPTYLPSFVPGMLDLLDALRLRVTVFAVGFDATRPEIIPLLREIVDRGHEIGNHSFSHECWMHRLTPDRIRDEIVRAEAALLEATGQRPMGFRGPGFSWSSEVLETLARRHYRYDASTLPTFLGPIARRYFLATARLSPEQRQLRSSLFGTFGEGFRPAGPYRWTLPAGLELLEIPVTTIPVVKTPFHMSYLLYLSRISKPLMFAYFRLALASCRLLHIPPSFLLHPLDLLSGDDVRQLSFFPGMDIPGEQKRATVAEILSILAREHDVVPMGTLAGTLLSHGELTRRIPVPAAHAEQSGIGN